jgi:hypothetical protein
MNEFAIFVPPFHVPTLTVCSVLCGPAFPDSVYVVSPGVTRTAVGSTVTGHTRAGSANQAASTLTFNASLPPFATESDAAAVAWALDVEDPDGADPTAFAVEVADAEGVGAPVSVVVGAADEVAVAVGAGVAVGVAGNVTNSYVTALDEARSPDRGSTLESSMNPAGIVAFTTPAASVNSTDLSAANRADSPFSDNGKIHELPTAAAAAAEWTTIDSLTPPDVDVSTTSVPASTPAKVADEPDTLAVTPAAPSNENDTECVASTPTFTRLESFPVPATSTLTSFAR